MDYREEDCHSYHICIRPLKSKTDTDKMNISVRSLVSAFEPEGKKDTVSGLPDIIQCSSQGVDTDEFPMGHCNMEDDDEDDEADEEDLHDESPVKLLKITRKTSCYYRKAPVVLPRGYKSKNCSGLLARSTSLCWDGRSGPEDIPNSAPPTRANSLTWEGRTNPATTSTLMKAIQDVLEQPKKGKKAKRKAPDKSDRIKLLKKGTGHTSHLLELFEQPGVTLKPCSDKYVCTEKIEDIQAKVQRWARSMAQDSDDNDDDDEFDKMNLEVDLSSVASRSGTEVISITPSPTCSQPDTDVVSIILVDHNNQEEEVDADDDFDHNFHTYNSFNLKKDKSLKEVSWHGCSLGDTDFLWFRHSMLVVGCFYCF